MEACYDTSYVYPSFEKIYSYYAETTSCATMVRQLKGNGAYVTIPKLYVKWLTDIPAFHELYKRKDDFLKEKEYLVRSIDYLESINPWTVDYATIFKLNNIQDAWSFCYENWAILVIWRNHIIPTEFE